MAIVSVLRLSRSFTGKDCTNNVSLSIPVSIPLISGWSEGWQAIIKPAPTKHKLILHLNVFQLLSLFYLQHQIYFFLSNKNKESEVKCHSLLIPRKRPINFYAFLI